VANQRSKTFTSPGKEWYKNNAIREVNQIIGRCIRHSKDYACIFLVDDRYGAPSVQESLSRWVRDRIRTSFNFGMLEAEVKGFFTSN
jgi:chromosome transmission fidelity protein 1